MASPRDELDARGVCVLRAACAGSACALCLAEVLAGLERMLSLPGPATVGGRHFMKVAVRTDTRREQPTHRANFVLPCSAAVEAVLRACLSGAAGALLTASLGRDAELCECTVVTAEPGATSQEMHADGLWSATAPRVVTLFLALHDIVDEAMGPTRYCPGTHAPRGFPGGRWLPPSDPQAEARPGDWFALSAGDAVLMEQTCWHCGGANTSEHRRTLLSLSFVAPAPAAGKRRGNGAPRLVDFVFASRDTGLERRN